MTEDALLKRMIDELLTAWHESGACATYNEPMGMTTRKCASCHRGEMAHRLLRWADTLKQVRLGI